jgi:hypothetical protein
VHAGGAEGRCMTHPLLFKGRKLYMNFSTSAAGYICVQLLDVAGTLLAESPPFYGDSIEEVVEWKEDFELSKLEGSPVRLQFIMKDADLYSIKFE